MVSRRAPLFRAETRMSHHDCRLAARGQVVCVRDTPGVVHRPTGAIPADETQAASQATRAPCITIFQPCLSSPFVSPFLRSSVPAQKIAAGPQLIVASLAGGGFHATG